MLNINPKKRLSYSCDVGIFYAILDRIKTISGYGQSTTGLKQYLLHAVKVESKSEHNGRLYVVGLSTDVTAYVTMDVDVEREGVCNIDIETLIGLIKKRKGKFSFSLEEGALHFTGGSYKGKVNAREIGTDIMEMVEFINADGNGVKLKSDTLAELKQAIKLTVSKHAVTGDPIPVHIQCKNGIFRASSHDDYHAVMYRSKSSNERAKDFALSMTNSAFNVIDKFLDNQSVSVEASNSLKLCNKDHLYATIPAIQSSETDFSVFTNADKLLKQKSISTFTISGEIYDHLINMFTLKKNSLEVAVSFAFKHVKGKLQVSYTTTAGSTQETFELLKSSGNINFSITEKVVLYTLCAFANFKKVQFFITDRTFCAYADSNPKSETEGYEIIGFGMLDDK